MLSQSSLASAIRVLAMDGVHAAYSGHPGAQGIAEIAEPRPLRALQRARLDAVLCLSAPDWLRPATRRIQTLPPIARHSGHPEYGRADDGKTTTAPLARALATPY